MFATRYTTKSCDYRKQRNQVIHDYRVYSYEASDEKGTRGYEDQFLEYLEKLIRDLDRRIQRGKERLERSATANQEVTMATQ